MPTWNVPTKLGSALFVAGDARLGEAARPALDRVLEALAKGPPPAVELRTWIVEHGRMGTLAIAAVREQIPSEAGAELAGDPDLERRYERATHGMIVAADESAALDPRAPWGLLILAATLASASDGVVYDSGTFRIVPGEILANPLDGFLLESIGNHVAILRSVDAAGMQLTTTLGLNKYGLFELQLGPIRETAGDVGALIAGLAQSVVDARPHAAGPWDVPASFEVTRLHVAHAAGLDVESTGGKTRLYVRPPSGADVYWDVLGSEGALDETAVRIALAALGIDGGAEAAVSNALAQATRIARNRLSEARDAFARQALTHDIVLVKKAFASSERSVDYVWLRVEQWSRTQLSAIVTTPAATVSYLGIGDRLTLDVDDIIDWRVERNNGESVGNFAETALRRINAE